MNKEFEAKLSVWLNDVAATCNKYAKEINLDFYPFQSSVEFNPDLLILGANPGGEGAYRGRAKQAEELRPEKGYNAYIAYENDPVWKINRPVIKMLSGENSRRVLAQSVIANVFYFNTRNIKELIALPNGKEIFDYCCGKTTELIYDIVKPKAVLFLGFDAPKWIKIPFSAKESSILRSDDDRSALIMKAERNGIPHYIVHHPSRNFQFNGGVNLEKKRAMFEEIFTSA